MGSNIVPHEGDLRARLRRLGVPEDEVSDVVQDAYLKISRLEDGSHIASGRAYSFTAARDAWLERIRHDRVVRIDSMPSYVGLDVMDDFPGPERQASAIAAELPILHRRAFLCSDLGPLLYRDWSSNLRDHGFERRDEA